jgi:TPR repeat protein
MEHPRSVISASLGRVVIAFAALVLVVTGIAPVLAQDRAPAVPVPETYTETLNWYARAAKAGDAAAQFLLGNILERGLNGPADPKAAAEWYRRAAEQGLAEAQFRFGELLYEGKVVPRDLDAAANWMTKAAEAGIAEAQYDMGLMTERGQGVPRDYAKAALWYWRAGHQGLAAAQLQLGAAFASGRGVGRDPVEALKWFDLAATGGQPVPKEFRDGIAASLTLAERDQAARAVRDFEPVKLEN